jgi:hypothetical protein
MGIKAKNESPQKGRKIEFRQEGSNAQEGCPVEDVNGLDLKAQRMRQNEKSLWTQAIAASHGRYEYRFYADGQWLNDPNNPLRCESYFGTEYNVLVVLS